MASKNISIDSDLYERLKKLKKPKESFSELLERLLNEGLKGSISRIMKHFGAWEDLPEEFDQITREFRKSMNENMESRIK